MWSRQSQAKSESSCMTWLRIRATSWPALAPRVQTGLQGVMRGKLGGLPLASSRRAFVDAEWQVRLAGRLVRSCGGRIDNEQRGRPPKRCGEGVGGGRAPIITPPLSEGWQVLMEPQEHRPGHQLWLGREY